MSPKKLPAKPVTELQAKIYLKKAEEFYQSMIEAYRRGRWNSAGLEGIHCAISATDALLGMKSRLRSTGESHAHAAELLRQHIHDERTNQQAGRFAQIIHRKNVVEYDARDFTQAEATGVYKDVDRYFTWVKELL